MPFFFAIVVFAAVLGAILTYGYRVYATPGQIYDQLAGQVGAPASPGLSMPDVVKFVESVGSRVPFDLERASRVRSQLLSCGYRSNRAVYVVAGLRLILLVAMILGILLFLPAHGKLLWIAVAMGALIAYRLPESALAVLGKRRQEKLRLALPDALDLIVICAEAGLGLDRAIQSVTREIEITHPELSEEFRLLALEMSAGSSRAQALHKLATRTGEGELRKFVSVLVQANRFGTSLSDALRIHADYLRIRRKHAAEERAGKVSVKLVFPVFFLILPSLLLVAAGPAVMSISRTLLPVLRNMGV